MAPPADPSGRIVVLGATGYTGELAVRALADAGVRPVLAGRDAGRLGLLAAELGGPPGPFEVALADVSDPESLDGLLDRGDVLVTTVGPFTRWGRPALDAAIAAGAHYVDSTGEGGFIRSVFEEADEPARAAGSVVLTAFGYDYVPGNLAAALALERARAGGSEPSSVDVGYFLTGSAGPSAVSGGTRASAFGVMGEHGHAFVDGRIVEQRPGTGVVRIAAGGLHRSGVTVAASEQFTLRRLAPTLRDVRVGLGWFGALTPAVAAASRAADAVDPVLDRVAERVPQLRSAASWLGRPLLAQLTRGSGGGPDARQRLRTGSLVAADVRGADGGLLAHVELTGPNPYALTGDLMGWAARTLAAGGATKAGALGPAEAFGLATLRDACADLGLAERTGRTA
ncbi:MAG TPA: saccharopine dehydrogenase NADP-binding domain-containing protein [Kineosporiaceae bacterium]|nr:saccharopine dehydrogenase NADP-binding domain-containing protein [Kineosporiaceae bacterium]